MKIIKSNVDKVKCPQTGQVIYWDDELKGFGLRVTPTRKTYIVQGRVAGRTVRNTIGLHGVLTPDEARKEARERLVALAKDIDINLLQKQTKEKKRTLQEAYIDYLHFKNLSLNTKKEYQRAMDSSFADWQDKPLQEINRNMITDRFKQLSVSPALANSDFRFLRALLNFAMEKYLIDGEPLLPSNPCSILTALKLWNKVARRTRYVSPEQIKDFLAGMKYAEGDTSFIKTVKNHCLFMLLTGTREQEAAKIKVKDIDFKIKTIVFPPENTKSHRKHILPTGEFLTNFLQSLCQGKKPEDYIFPSDAKCGHLKYHNHAVRKISTKIGVPFAMHDLRRTFISIVDHSLRQTFSEYTLKRLLNHSNQDVTGGYIQYGIEDLRKPMQMIEDFILEKAQ